MHLSVYKAMMQRYWSGAVKRGSISADSTPEQFFGFRAIDVAEVHHYMVKDGQGTWFRLDDGRVINMWGEQEGETDRFLYDPEVPVVH